MLIFDARELCSWLPAFIYNFSSSEMNLVWVTCDSITGNIVQKMSIYSWFVLVF